MKKDKFADFCEFVSTFENQIHMIGLPTNHCFVCGTKVGNSVGWNITEDSPTVRKNAIKKLFEGLKEKVLAEKCETVVEKSFNITVDSVAFYSADNFCVYAWVEAV